MTLKKQPEFNIETIQDLNPNQIKQFNSRENINIPDNHLLVSSGNIRTLSQHYPISGDEIYFVKPPSKISKTPQIFVLVDINKLANHCKENPNSMVDALSTLTMQLGSEVHKASFKLDLIDDPELKDDYENNKNVVIKKLKTVKLNHSALIRLLNYDRTNIKNSVLEKQKNSDLAKAILESLKTYGDFVNRVRTKLKSSLN